MTSCWARDGAEVRHRAKAGRRKLRRRKEKGERVGSLIKVTVESGITSRGCWMSSLQPVVAAKNGSLTHLLFQPKATEARQWARLALGGKERQKT